MATVQLSHSIRTCKASKETVFPSRVTNERESLMMVKKLFATSISCITYLRGLFPESSYGDRHLDDLNLKILREDKRCPGSLHIIKWIQGCFDALEKRYLHVAVLTLYTNPKEPEITNNCISKQEGKFVADSEVLNIFLDECKTSSLKAVVLQVVELCLTTEKSFKKVTEIYQFKFKYTTKGATMDFDSNSTSFASGANTKDIKKASVLLIRRLYVLVQNLGPLPNDVMLTMTLHYYNAVTPHDYQPPGFKEGMSSHFLLFDGEPMGLQMGLVSTGFHNMKVKVTTEATRVPDMEDNLFQEHHATEIAHQGLDCDEEDEDCNSQIQRMNFVYNESSFESSRKRRKVSEPVKVFIPNGK